MDAAEPLAIARGRRADVPNASQLSPARTVAYATAAAVTIAAIAILCLVKHVPMGRFTNDFAALLDGGARIAQGQWPHIDFAVPHGPWPVVQGWIALKLAPWWVPFLTYQFTQWLTVLPAAVYLAAQQPTGTRAASLLGICAVATLIPYVIEAENIPGFSYYAGYNRLTTALMFLTFVWALTPRRKTWLDAGVLGYLLFAMLATKVTGFAVGLGVVAVAAAVAPVKRVLLLRACGLLVAVLLVLQIATRLPSAYFADVHSMAALNKGGVAYFFLSMILKSLVALLAAGALIIAVAPPRQGAWLNESLRAIVSRPLIFLRNARAPLMIVVVAAAAIAAESQNTGSLLLASVAALLFAPLPRDRASPVFLAGAEVALAVAILGPWFGSVIYRGMLVATREVPQLVIERPLAAIVPGEVTTRETAAIATDLERVWQTANPPQTLLATLAATTTEPATFVALTRTIGEAGLKAQREGFVTPDTRVMTLSPTNLFARALGARSPVGINLWQDPQRTFGRPTPEALRHYLRNVDAAFMQRCAVDASNILLNEIFLPSLEANFVEHDLTPCWSVWTRKPLPS